jgi:hypothetical protein
MARIEIGNECRIIGASMQAVFGYVRIPIRLGMLHRRVKLWGGSETKRDTATLDVPTRIRQTLSQVTLDFQDSEVAGW